MNKPTKKLYLSRETIRNLQPDELNGVAGASDETFIATVITLVVSIVLSKEWSCICPKPQ